MLVRVRVVLDAARSEAFTAMPHIYCVRVCVLCGSAVARPLARLRSFRVLSVCSISPCTPEWQANYSDFPMPPGMLFAPPLNATFTNYEQEGSRLV